MLPKPCSVRSALLFLSWFIGAAALAAYPEKPIRFVIPSAAGGSPDVLMRVMTQQLSTQIGVPFVVEDGSTAVLVPPRCPAEMATAALRILGEPALAARLRAAGIDASKRHAWTQVRGQLFSVYARVLGVPSLEQCLP